MKTTQSKLRYLLISLLAVLSMTMSVVALAVGPGDGANGATSPGNDSGTGGTASTTGAGGAGGDSTGLNSGGGGGAGVTGGAGGSTASGGVGGAGGSAAVGGVGGNGGDGTGIWGGASGGGGGGAAGLVVTTTSTNSGAATGGNGGSGDAGISIISGGGGGGGAGALVSGNITFTNSGTLTGGNGGFGYSWGRDGAGAVLSGGASLINTSSGSIAGGGAPPFTTSAGVIGSGTYNINNAGTITGGTYGGINNLGTITTLINTGTITASAPIDAYGIDNAGTITTLTNTGTISGETIGISNTGTITTLNNSQGAAGALTYTGTLPTNYNIIINSTSSFGKLSVTSGTGSTTFGIYTGSTVSAGHTYTAVLSGIGSSNLGSLTGTYGSYSWTLSPEATCTTDCIYDLTIAGGGAPTPTGPSAQNTNQSLVNTATNLQNNFALQNSVLANSFAYDCNVFGANNVCVSAGGRNTAVQAANGLNNTSALLIAAYRPHPNYRIGAYADQNLSVNNAGSTVNLGNNTPLIGLFGAWNQRLDGTGTEVKVSAAYGQKNTTVNRSVVGSGATASEAGSGSSALNSQGAQVIAKYGFAVTDKAIVSPYVGMRYTQNNMGGYTEGASTTVTAPLTYSALNTNATTALAGVGASYKVIPTVTTFASAGVETDTNTANGSYSGTSSSIAGLNPVNFNANPVKTRPTVTLGAYYDVAKNQRLGLAGIYRQESYQAVSTTTVLATYTVGL